MITRLAHVSLYVRDYDEALRFYTDVLGLELRNDRPIGDNYRWVTVAPPGQAGVEIVLHRPGDPHAHAAFIGAQPGMVFHTDDCRAEVARLAEKGVEIARQPHEVPWGIQAVFRDLYGNTHVLVQPAGA